MNKQKQLSYSTAVILQALSNGYRYGFDIMDVTGLPSGTIYPALRRLEMNGFVKSYWEDEEIAQSELRPPRKYYEVTGDGAEMLKEVLKRYRGIENIFPVHASKTSEA